MEGLLTVVSSRLSLPLRKTLIFASVTLGIGLVVGGLAVLAQYRGSLARERVVLSQLVESHARLIEAVARFDARFSHEDVEGGALAATLSQVAEAQEAFQGFDDSGVFVLGEGVGDSIVFHAVSRAQRAALPGSLPRGAAGAEPLQAAVAGRVGTLVGLDFRGIPVLAAYRPLELPGSRLGLVAKKDMAEVRAPAWVSGRRIGGAVAALCLLLALAFHILGLPFIQRMEDREVALEEAERALEEAEANLETTEEALEETEWRFQATFEQAAVGIAHVSPEGELLRVNRRFGEITGYSMEELKTLTFQEITHPDDVDGDEMMLAELLEGHRQAYSMEKRYIRMGGEPVWVQLTVSMVREDGGHPGFVIGVVQDISDRKEAEEELRRAMDRLARSNTDLQQFAYVASHDLQEPLRMVSSFTQLLADRYRGRLDREADEFINYAVDGANRMQALIQGLLRYSRVETRGGDFTPTDSARLLTRVMKDFQAAIEEKNVEVILGELPTVVADQDQLTRVFMNLIQNAMKFGPETGLRIHVGAERREGEWVFRVRDNGPGIDPAYFDRIFQIYQRLGSRKDYPGTGIGLSICQRIIQRHEGRIWVESGPGEGASFFFTIPDRSFVA